MYIVIVYDVRQKRVNKICKFLRRHLNWVQNSVFEGEVSEGQLFKVKKGIERLINKKSDSILIYRAISKRWLERDVLGVEKNLTSNLV